MGPRFKALYLGVVMAASDFSSSFLVSQRLAYFTHNLFYLVQECAGIGLSLKDAWHMVKIVEVVAILDVSLSFIAAEVKCPLYQ